MALSVEKIFGFGVAAYGLYKLLGDGGTKVSEIFGGFGITMPSTNLPQNSGSTLDDLYKHYAAQNGLDWKLLKAVAIVESGENPNAVNPTDPSYGLMQVLCKPDGSGGCSNNVNVIGWENATAKRLLAADFNLSIAAQILAWNIRTYGESRGIAVYNNWGARNSPPNGPFPNEEYVQKVLLEYSFLDADGIF